MPNPNFEALRNSPNISRLMATARDKFILVDFYRVIAAVEDCNAKFEAFYLRDYEDRPGTILGFPVYYSNEVHSSELFGGMWSDLDEKGIPKHQAAFAMLLTY